MITKVINLDTYDLYGLGNALVDLEYVTDESTLNELSIEKGVMTLIDEKTNQSLENNNNLDIVKKSGGGSAANTVIGFTQLGGKSFYSCISYHRNHSIAVPTKY